MSFTHVALTCLGALTAIWIGYPVAVYLLASLKGPRPTGRGAPVAPVTVVIAVRADAATVERRIDDALAATYDGPLEVVVGLDPNGPLRAADASHPDPRVRFVDGAPPGGKAATLNVAAAAATGEILVFADAHQRFEPDAVSALVRALEADGRLGAVSGALSLSAAGRRSPVGLYWRYERWLREREGRVHSTVGVTGAIYAMRARAWSPLPAGLILDDVYNPMRLVLEGWRVGFEPGAVALETRTTSVGSEYGRKVRTLTGNIQLCAWLPAILVPWRNPVWIQFLFHKLLRLLTPYLALAPVAWLAVEGGRIALRHPSAALLALGVLALAHLVGRVSPLRLAGRTLVWGGALQVAVVAATLNGLRRRWNVWD